MTWPQLLLQILPLLILAAMMAAFIKRKFAVGLFFGILLTAVCGAALTDQVFGSVGHHSHEVGYAIVMGYAVGLILISTTARPARLTERLCALEAKIDRLTAAPLPAGQTEFTVALQECPPDRKITVVKVTREITGLTLKDAKHLVEAAPSTIKEGISRADAEAIAKRFDETGAKVVIK